MTSPLGELLSGQRGPLEMQCHICSFLEPKDLATASSVCKGIEPGVNYAWDQIEKYFKYHADENKPHIKNYSNFTKQLAGILCRYHDEHIYIPKEILKILNLTNEDIKTIISTNKLGEIKKIISKIPIPSIQEVQRIQEFFRIRDLLLSVKKYPTGQVPQEINVILEAVKSRTLTEHERQLLQTYIQTRDALLLWDRDETFDGLDTVEAYTEKANGFPEWLKKNTELLRKKDHHYRLFQLDAFSNRHFTFIHPGIKKLRTSEGLKLNKNCLSCLPREFEKFTSLRILELNENRFTSIPTEIMNSSNLQLLHMCKNRIRNFPEIPGKFQNLLSLELRENYLEAIPESVGELGKLIKLDLTRNKITKIPKRIGDIKELRLLLLDGNRLSSLPKEIGQLTSLALLGSENNRLSSLPQTFKNLTDLRTLGLGSNRFTSIPKAVMNMKKLKILYLDNNLITFIPNKHIDLRNLEELDLQRNFITSVPKVLDELTNLKHLDLDGNYLSTIPQEITRMPSLTTLSVKDNPLTSTPTLEHGGQVIADPPKSSSNCQLF